MEFSKALPPYRQTRSRFGKVVRVENGFADIVLVGGNTVLKRIKITGSSLVAGASAQVTILPNGEYICSANGLVASVDSASQPASSVTNLTVNQISSGGTPGTGDSNLSGTIYVPTGGGFVGINQMPTSPYVLDVLGSSRFKGDVVPFSANAWSLGASSASWRNVYATDLFVSDLVGSGKISTASGRIVVAASTKLIAVLTAEATSIQVSSNSLSSGDRIYLESGSQLEWMSVTSGPTVVFGGYQYDVARNLNGAGAQVWSIGDLVVNTGTTGQGFIDSYSSYGIPASGQSSTARQGPTITGNVRTGTAWDAIRERWAVGNLKGLFDYGSAVYGFAAGDPTAAWISADATNGIRLMNNTTNLGQWSAAGGITIGEVAASKSNVAITSGALTIRNNTTERVKLTAAGVLTINDSSGAAVFTFDSAAGAEFTKPLALGSGGGIYQGSGSFASPITGLKIWSDSGVGRIAGYNGGAVQWYADSDGYLKAQGIWIGNTGMTLGGDVIRWTDDGTPTGTLLSEINLPFTEPGRQIWRFDFPGNTSGTQIIQFRCDRVDAVAPIASPGTFRGGKLELQNETTGLATLAPPSGAVTPTLTLPTTTGTLALTSDVASAVSGATGKLAKFTGANTIGNSILTESGSNISVNGSLSLSGATSGAATIQAPAVAGTPTLTLPTSSGTLALLSDVASGGVSGTTGKLAKFTSASAVGDSLVSESGTNVAIAGSLSLSGSTSGSATIQTPAVAGTPTLTLPTTSGTLALLSDISAGGLSGSGTTGKIAKFTGTNAVGNSILSESGSVVSAAGSFSATTSVIAQPVAAPGSPADGETWNDSTRQSLVGRLAGINQTLSGVIFTSTADGGVATPTTTETSIIGSGVGTRTLPANFWAVGKAIRFTARGWWQYPALSNGQDMQVRLKLGSTTIVSAQLARPAQTGGASIVFSWDIICRAIGSSGNVYALGNMIQGQYQPPYFVWLNGAPAVNTTQSALIDLTWRWFWNINSSSITINNVIIEVLN